MRSLNFASRAAGCTIIALRAATSNGRSRMIARPVIRTLIVLLALATPSLGPAASAQLPGLPVLQNAFGNPGLSAAFDFGSGAGASTYVGAVSYGAGRLILSGGVGAFVPDSGSTAASFGARVALPLVSFVGGSVGVAAFAGVGGVSLNDVSTTQAPLGVAVGWRRRFGTSRGVSVYAAPLFSYDRASGDGESESAWRFQYSVGADLALTRRLGLTIGVGSAALPGQSELDDSDTVFGAGIAWAFGAR
jgi:hypothetical protein